jgi:hypothetical protein
MAHHRARSGGKIKLGSAEAEWLPSCRKIRRAQARRADATEKVEADVAEVFVRFTEPVVADGVAYMARACGRPTSDGLWQGWVEFTPVEGGPTRRSRRETTQPNRVDAVYWATGLSLVYLEGALKRTLQPRVPPLRSADVPAFDSPAAETDDICAHIDDSYVHAILDPFSAYRKGEELLRQQLSALSEQHLINIIRAYGLSSRYRQDLTMLNSTTLIEIIVSEVKATLRRGASLVGPGRVR